MHRNTLSQNGYATKKRDDDEAFSQYPHRSDLENKYIWSMQDLIEDEKADARFPRRFEPRRSALQNRNRLYKILGLVAAVAVFFTFFIFPSTISVRKTFASAVLQRSQIMGVPPGDAGHRRAKRDG